MSADAGDRPGDTAPSGAGGDRPFFSRANVVALPASEIEIGRELVALLDKELAISVDPDLQVRVRIYASDRRTLLINVATTAQRALVIAGLFQRAAFRADTALVALPPIDREGGQ